MDHMLKEENYLLAVSRAGHDTGRTYVVCDLDGQYVWLVNGTTRKLDHPKKKKRMHVQLIRHLPPEMRQLLKNACSDDQIRQVIEQRDAYLQSHLSR